VFFSGFNIGAVAMVSRQIIDHDVADFMKGRLVSHLVI